MTDRPWTPGNRKGRDERMVAEECMLQMLPCPFCGLKKFKIQLTDQWPMDWTWVVNCDQCEVEFGFYSNEPDEAVERWNRRAP